MSWVHGTVVLFLAVNKVGKHQTLFVHLWIHFFFSNFIICWSSSN